MTPPTVAVCFVCLGNICRSPTAEGVFRALVAREGLDERFVIDSAGTSAHHAGELADARSRAHALKRNYRLTSRSRPVSKHDYQRFDMLVAMDRSNLSNLTSLAPPAPYRAQIVLLRSFDPTSPPDAEVPDPYYGGDRGFEEVLDICERACEGLLSALRAKFSLLRITSVAFP